jgi:prevent-host-death family protein
LKTVGAFEAKTHLSQLLDEVSEGTEVLITRHGHGLARLIPHNPSPARQRAEAIARLRSFRADKRLDGISLQQLRDAGRKR